MRTDNKDYFLQVTMETIKMGFKLIPVADVFNDLSEQIWVEVKGIYEEIFDEFYKDHTLDQMKIMYTRDSNSLLRSYNQTFLQMMSNFEDYLKYGIAHYNSPWEEFQDSGVLRSIRKIFVGFSKLFAVFEPFITDYKMSVTNPCGFVTEPKSYCNLGSQDYDSNPWDGNISDDVWSQIIQGKYQSRSQGRSQGRSQDRSQDRSADDCFTDTEKETIFHHSANRFYNDLMEKHPQAVVIINDYINKHESVFMSFGYISSRSDERVKAITKEKMQNRLDELRRQPVTMYMEINGVRIYEGTVNPCEVVRLGDGIAFSDGSAELSDK